MPRSLARAARFINLIYRPASDGTTSPPCRRATGARVPAEPVPARRDRAEMIIKWTMTITRAIMTGRSPSLPS